MRERVIVSDLDGVVLDCLRPALRYHQRHDLAADPTYPPSYSWAAGTGISDKEFWARIEDAGPTFWSELPFTTFGEALLTYLFSLSHRVEIATKVVGANNSAGKWNWAQRVLPAGTRFHMTTDKSSLAQPDWLLIDDSPENIREWAKRGGDVILVPASYNLNREFVGHELAYIKSEVERLGYGRLCD